MLMIECLKSIRTLRMRRCSLDLNVESLLCGLIHVVNL